jgi:DNA modification methylase
LVVKSAVVDQAFGDDWAMYMGDSAEVLKGLPTDSIDLSVYSPPFSSLFTYSASERDLGNSRNDAEFFEHFRFIIGEVLRITKPGRVSCCHVADVPAMLARDGYIGLKDFSGEVIRAFIAAGWTFDARVPIDKNQQAQSIRTHAKGLTMTQMEKDRTWSRPALPDYILKFRKPGDNRVPVNGGDVTRDLWIEYANPTWPGDGDRCADAGSFATWYGIRESDTLQVAPARTADDERHICPLQLGTIERCIRLWSNPGETVLSPFAGIGSEGHEAVRLGRRFIGVELKPEYWRVGVHNLRRAETARTAPTLFSTLEVA